MQEEKSSIDTSLVNNTLEKVAKSTTIIFFGGLLGGILFLFVKLLIIRNENWSQADYGIYSITMVIPSIFIIISTLGLRDAIVRNIAYARGKNDTEKIKELVSTSTIVFILFGLIAGIILFLSAEYIAVEIYNEPNLVIPLKIISITIPIAKIAGIASVFFRSYDQIGPQILFINILKPAIIFLCVGVIVLLNLSINDVYYSFIIAGAITSTLIFLFAIKKLKIKKLFSIKNFNNKILKTLIIFSLPLLGSALINYATNWIDTLMLASFKGVIDVALYNAVVPISSLITYPLGAVAVIYMPVISRLYSGKKQEEIKRHFKIVTKWLFLISLPIFTTFFLFSEEIILFLFEAEYLPASLAFRIVCFGAIIFNLIGLNNQNLIVIGKTRTIMISFFIGAITNIGLNIYLIPIYGIDGAAFASIVSLFVSFVLMSLIVYKNVKLHPFSKNLFKPIILFYIIMLSLYFFSIKLFNYDIILIVIFYLFCNFIMFISLCLTKSVDKEDLNMLQILAKKTKINLSFFEKIFRKSM
jgi:O-antigen/teichoic acid export membrane protein